MQLSTQERIWVNRLIDAYFADSAPPDPPSNVDVEHIQRVVRPAGITVMVEALESIRDMRDPVLEDASRVAEAALLVAHKLDKESEADIGAHA